MAVGGPSVLVALCSGGQMTGIDNVECKPERTLRREGSRAA